MATDSRYEDLAQHVRTIESDVEGERHVTRRVLEHLQQINSELATGRGAADTLALHVNRLADDMSVVKATLVRHGRALDVLQQDVRQMRSEMASMREELLSAIRALANGAV